ncbi:MAG: InlB B-repeat-containing protein, partial [Clostridia bacterium]|nr:InlB B-repeat-containing protein [Clostridia bacterium]
LPITVTYDNDNYAIYDMDFTLVDFAVVNGSVTVEGGTIDPPHTHTFGEWNKVDDTNHKRVCACGEEELEAHTWNEGEVTTPATHTTEGVMTYTCTVCGGTKTEPIAKLTGHTFGEWTKVDDTNHKRVCACGEEELEAHTWNEGEVTTPATHTTEGVKTYTCTVCGGTKTEPISKLTEHTFETWVKVDETYHKGVCACGEETENEAHTWNNGVETTPATHTAEGVKTYTCTKCGATKTEPISKLTEHTFETWVKVDETYHKGVCACGEETENEAHTWNNGVETTPATHTAEGVKTYTCTKCGATKTEPIEKIKVPATSFGFEQMTLGLKVGETGQITAVIEPADAANLPIEWTSTNPNVAKVENGVVTALKAGFAVIDAKITNPDGSELGASCPVKVTEDVEITAIDVEAKTATFSTDALTADDLDFDKLSVSKVFEGNNVAVTVTNFVLKGEKAEYYSVVTKSKSYNAVAPSSTNTEVSEGITATTVVYDDTAKVDITDSSALTDDKAVIDVTAESDVNAVAISATAMKDLADNDNAIEIKVKDETGADTSMTFSKAAIIAMTDGVTADITIRVSNPDDEDLTEDQQEKTAEAATKNPVVYSLTVEGAATTDFGTNSVTVKLYYDKTTEGTIVVKYIKDDGSEEIITTNADYNSTDKVITVLLSHFSEYLVYTEPASKGHSVSGGVSGGGGASSTDVTVKLNTNGGEEMKDITVTKGQAIGTIAEPTKNGYVFTGWYADEALTKEYSADEKVTDETTLYAGWKVDPVRQITLTINNVNATVFGEEKANDVAPIIRNDRTMLPIRFIAEALGAEVGWDGETRTVTITSGETVITIGIDQSFATVNGSVIALDSPAFIESDRTFLPIRFVSENLGAEVEWVEASRQVVITKPIAE